MVTRGWGFGKKEANDHRVQTSVIRLTNSGDLTYSMQITPNNIGVIYLEVATRVNFKCPYNKKINGKHVTGWKY